MRFFPLQLLKTDEKCKQLRITINAIKIPFYREVSISFILERAILKL